jgi:hypothetical protein
MNHAFYETGSLITLLTEDRERESMCNTPISNIEKCKYLETNVTN